MKCELGIEKKGTLACEGKFCIPDGVTSTGIAGNFSTPELLDRFNKVREDLEKNPQSCRLQAAFSEFRLALKIKGVDFN